MKKKQIYLSLMGVMLAFPMLAGTAHASPVLLITHPPVSNSGQTGPAIDASASKGQWFQNVTGFNGSAPIVGNDVESRPLQLYDNLTGSGGGSASTNAIKGVITKVELDPINVNLALGFTIRASITNDTPPVGSWADGANTHGETLSTTDSYSRSLAGVKLTVNFADDGKKDNFPTGTPAFMGSEPNIYATNYNELAWYSFTTTGGFYVPTYDFGNIGIGQTVTKDLNFLFYNPENAAQYQQWLTNGNDLFYSRSPNLKIGYYGSVLQPDTGGAYPYTNLFSGNVSVFAIPEPTTLSLFGIGLAGMAFGKRRPKN